VNERGVLELLADLEIAPGRRSTGMETMQVIVTPGSHLSIVPNKDPLGLRRDLLAQRGRGTVIRRFGVEAVAHLQQPSQVLAETNRHPCGLRFKGGRVRITLVLWRPVVPATFAGQQDTFLLGPVSLVFRPTPADIGQFALPVELAFLQPSIWAVKRADFAGEIWPRARVLLSMISPLPIRVWAVCCKVVSLECVADRQSVASVR